MTYFNLKYAAFWKKRRNVPDIANYVQFKAFLNDNFFLKNQEM